ncbi:MAG: hypothetical protein SGBAC_006805 [Bacillariaceae sp.]
MAGGLGWLWLYVGVAYAQTAPAGHIPGNVNLSSGNLCDLSDSTTLIGEVTVSQDATLFEGFGESAASKDYFIAGLTENGVRRSLLKFDLAGVGFPADFQVLCAEVRLSLDSDLSSSDETREGISLHEVTQDWTSNKDTAFEGLNGSIATNGDVTWEFMSYPTKRWANMGGDFGGDPLSRQQKTTAADGSEYEWFGNSKRMHALVNQWIGDSNSNHGVLIKGNELPNGPIAYNVYHDGERTSGLAPKLIVVYTAPTLGYPHKVAQDPNVPTNTPTDGPEVIGSPTGSPTIFDDMFFGIPTDTPTFDPTYGSSPTTPGNNDGSSSDSDSDSDDTRESNSNAEYTAVALSITGIALAAVVASLFGMIPVGGKPVVEEAGDNPETPPLGTATEVTAPVGHAPGQVGQQQSFNLCDLTNDKMLVGEISMSQDTTLFAGFSSSTASMGEFTAGRTPDGVRRALLSFDLSSVNWPSDVKVACAEVRLAVDSAASVMPPSANGLTLHKVTTAWTTNGNTHLDGIHGGNAQHGDATWQYASFPNEEWQNPGGDFAGDSLSRESTISSTDGIKYSYFGSTKRMHAIVNEWIEYPKDNHGMLIKSDELADDPIGYKMYHGAESNPKLIPKLIVVYTAPSLGYEHPDFTSQHHVNNTSNKPDLGGFFDNEGNWHQIGNIPDLNPTSNEGNNDTPIETPSTNSNSGNGNTDKATDTPTAGDGTYLGNIKPTFPPLSHDDQKQTHQDVNPPVKRESNSSHAYIAVVATCSVVAVILVGVSVLSMRGGTAQPAQVTAGDVIGNDLSLSSEAEFV